MITIGVTPAITSLTAGMSMARCGTTQIISLPHTEHCAMISVLPEDVNTTGATRGKVGTTARQDRMWITKITRARPLTLAPSTMRITTGAT